VAGGLEGAPLLAGERQSPRVAAVEEEDEALIGRRVLRQRRASTRNRICAPFGLAPATVSTTACSAASGSRSVQWGRKPSSLKVHR
jgi:hypothetical protein